MSQKRTNIHFTLLDNLIQTFIKYMTIWRSHDLTLLWSMGTDHGLQRTLACSNLFWNILPQDLGGTWLLMCHQNRHSIYQNSPSLHNSKSRWFQHWWLRLRWNVQRSSLMMKLMKKCWLGLVACRHYQQPQHHCWQASIVGTLQLHLSSISSCLCDRQLPWVFWWHQLLYYPTTAVCSFPCKPCIWKWYLCYQPSPSLYRLDLSASSYQRKFV